MCEKKINKLLSFFSSFIIKDAKHCLEVTGQILLVESIIVHLHLGEGAKIVRHEHDGRMNVLQLTHRVIHAPHEDREEGVAGAEQLSLRVFHFEAFSLGGGLAFQ